MFTNTDDLTIGQLKELKSIVGNDSGSPRYPTLKPGSRWMFFGVPSYTLGEVVEQAGAFVRLKGGGWVADTGRLHEAFQHGTVSEFEPFGADTWVNLDATTRIVAWEHDLISEAK